MNATPTGPDPIIITVRRYRCPFCRRSHSRRDGIVPHIARCWHNPASRACGTCRHYRYGYHGGLGERVDDPWCEAGRDIHEPDPDDPGAQRTVRNCSGWEPRSTFRPPPV